MKENNKISVSDLVMVAFPVGEKTNNPAHELDGQQFVVKTKCKTNTNKGGDTYQYTLYGAESKAGKPYTFLTDDMTAKEFLRQYRRLTVRIRQLDLDIMELEESYDSISIDYSGMPHGSNIADRTAQLATQMGGLRLQKVQLRSEALEKREEIIKVINRVDDPVQSQLLYDRYILFMTWERIAEDCDRSDKWCRTELHSRALQSVNKILGTSL